MTDLIQRIEAAKLKPWSLVDHRKQEYIGGATHNSSWTELLLDGGHIAHFPDREMAEVVLAALTQPQPSAEPVAWMYELDRSRRIYETRFPMQIPGWTETPLYPASALEAARREGELIGRQKERDERVSRNFEA